MAAWQNDYLQGEGWEVREGGRYNISYRRDRLRDVHRDALSQLLGDDLLPGSRVRKIDDFVLIDLTPLHQHIFIWRSYIFSYISDSEINLLPSAKRIVNKCLNIKFELQVLNIYLCRIWKVKYFRLCFVKLRLLLLAIQAKQTDGGKKSVTKLNQQD